MMSFAQFGNDLYTGKRSIPVVGQRRRFYLGSAVVMVIALLGMVVNGLNLGLEFTGGSEYRVSSVANTNDYEARARAIAGEEQNASGVKVTLIGGSTIRVQTEQADQEVIDTTSAALAKEFDVAETEVSATTIGPSWGASVSRQAFKALITFLVLVAIAMALYFRTWKMALAALIALAHDLIITAGIYAWTGFEVSPATMIGFLTVLGYSLYDTVVVFDKVRENTTEAFANGRQSFANAANLAVNQTMVRSINTTVVALLPITSILVVGIIKLGPGTLLDLALVLFIGILVGAYSSIFIATPLLVTLRAREEAVLDLEKRAARHQARKEKVEVVPVGVAGAEPTPGVVGEEPFAEGGEGGTLTGRAVHRYAQQSGPRNQPRRTPKSKR